MYRPSDKEVEALIASDAATRYAYFIKRVADSEEAWGLRDGGLAMTADDAGLQQVVLWPAHTYAELCASGEWRTSAPSSIPLDRLLDQILPDLEDQGLGVAVFHTPSGKGVVATAQQVARDLRHELRKYDE